MVQFDMMLLQTILDAAPVAEVTMFALRSAIYRRVLGDVVTVHDGAGKCGKETIGLRVVRKRVDLDGQSNFLLQK